MSSPRTWNYPGSVLSSRNTCWTHSAARMAFWGTAHPPANVCNLTEHTDTPSCALLHPNLGVGGPCMRQWEPGRTQRAAGGRCTCQPVSQLAMTRGWCREWQRWVGTGWGQGPAEGWQGSASSDCHGREARGRRGHPCDSTRPSHMGTQCCLLEGRWCLHGSQAPALHRGQ